MKLNTLKSAFVTFSLLVAGTELGCGLKGDDCEWKSNCAPETSAGTNSGGTNSATGGKSSGGSSGTHKGGTGGIASASSGGKAGSSTTAPCNGACTGTKPICDTDKNECVECTKSDDCKADATKPVCNTTKGACVACNGNNDCKDATASRCDTATNTCSACSVDDDCKQISGRGLCLTGDATLPNQCVQCTGKRYSACGQLEGTDLVCDSLAHTCTTDKKVKTASECQPCVSDAQCIAGQLCAKQMYGDKDAGNFCFWKQGDPTSGAPKDCPLDAPHPYVKVDKDLVSVDGEKATLCTLTVSTCKALNQFRTENCAPTGEWDDQYCGISPGLDSKCAAYGASQHRCTITCVTSDDCVSPTTCAPVSGVRICSFQ